MNFFANGGTNCGCGCNDYILILLLVCCCGCNICDILPWLLIMNCCGGHGVGCCKQQANKQKKHSLASAFFVVQRRGFAALKAFFLLRAKDQSLLCQWEVAKSSPYKLHQSFQSLSVFMENQISLDLVLQHIPFSFASNSHKSFLFSTKNISILYNFYNL